MESLNRINYQVKERPIKVLQFGSGNFLRAFIDWMIQVLNEKTDFNAGVICLTRGTNSSESLNQQDGLYHTILNGINEQDDIVREVQLIDCIQREIDLSRNYYDYLALAKLSSLEWVFSNTTEAGLVFYPGDRFDFECVPESFPAKLTQFLYVRYEYFQGDLSVGLKVLPCELIENNGEVLKSIILQYADLWGLPEDFKNWVEAANQFYSTLVDRIVPGFPMGQKQLIWEEIGCEDQFLVMAEYFYLFVIEAPESLKQQFHLDKVPLNILVTDDLDLYRQQKVALLNGGHTGLLPVAFLSGKTTVKAALEDPLLEKFLMSMLKEEVVSSLTLPKELIDAYTNNVIQRFKNPFIEHQWLSIGLNSMAKFKTRNLPALLDYVAKNETSPHLMSFSLASLMILYRGKLNETFHQLSDDQKWLSLYETKWQAIDNGELRFIDLVNSILGDAEHWGCNLLEIPQLSENVNYYGEMILANGMTDALHSLMDWYLVE